MQAVTGAQGMGDRASLEVTLTQRAAICLCAWNTAPCVQRAHQCVLRCAGMHACLAGFGTCGGATLTAAHGHTSTHLQDMAARSASACSTHSCCAELCCSASPCGSASPRIEQSDTQRTAHCRYSTDTCRHQGKSSAGQVRHAKDPSRECIGALDSPREYTSRTHGGIECTQTRQDTMGGEDKGCPTAAGVPCRHLGHSAVRGTGLCGQRAPRKTPKQCRQANSAPGGMQQQHRHKRVRKPSYVPFIPPPTALLPPHPGPLHDQTPQDLLCMIENPRPQRGIGLPFTATGFAMNRTSKAQPGTTPGGGRCCCAAAITSSSACPSPPTELPAADAAADTAAAAAAAAAALLFGPCATCCCEP